MTRPYLLPPGTPKERVQILRQAYMNNMKDPEFLAETKKAKLDINPDDGAGLERNVEEVFNLEPSLVAKLKEILK
jgi:tripartite-type tricarboxylate transporter receptor subunit TctC